MIKIISRTALRVRAIDGTAALPSITFVSDADTGIWRPAADTIAISTAGVEALRINSALDIGIQTSDIEAWGTGYGAIEFPRQAIMFASGSNDLYILSNAYYDGAFKYKRTAAAARYFIESDGTHFFQVAPSGTIDTGITWTTGIFIDGSGNVGAGGTPAAKLHVLGDNARPFSISKSTVAAVAPGAGVGMLRWEAGTNAGTLKIVGYAGTSSTGTTLIDNIGAGN